MHHNTILLYYAHAVYLPTSPANHFGVIHMFIECLFSSLSSMQMFFLKIVYDFSGEWLDLSGVSLSFFLCLPDMLMLVILSHVASGINTVLSLHLC